MTTPAPAAVKPQSLPADGNLKVVWVPALADPSAPTVAELTAAAAIDLTCFLTGDGYDHGIEQAASTDDRLCSRQTFEQPGSITDSLSLTYVFRAQAAATADRAYGTLKPDILGFVIARWGKAFELPPVAGDVVDVLPTACGVQMKQKPERNARLKAMQKMFVTDTVRRDVKVV